MIRTISAVALAGGLLAGISAEAAAPKAKVGPAPKVSVSPQGRLTVADLSLIALESLKPADPDPFRPKQASKYAGRHFVVSVPFKPSSERGPVIGHWRYELDIKRISFSLLASSFEDYPIYSRSNELPGYSGQNAYGAKVWVKRFSDLDVSIVPGSLPAALSGYHVEIFAEPEAARALSQRMKAVIEGTLVERDGAVARCEDSFDAATFQHPDELTLNECGLAVDIDAVRFEADGKVYARWPEGQP